MYNCHEDVRAMYISCCASASLCQLVAECGFDRVVLSASELERSSQEQIQGLSRTLNHFHLTCRSLNDFCPPELKLCGPEYKLGQVEQYVSNLAPRAAELGITQIGIGAPLSRKIPSKFPRKLADEQLLECMCRAAEICKPYQIRILMEPICGQMTNVLNSTKDTFQFIQLCNDLGMIYDIYHAWMMGEDPAAVLPAMDKIEMVHIAHASNGRYPLTRGNIHYYLPYLQMLQELGYQGEIAIECGMTQMIPALLAESYHVLKEVSAPNYQVAIC